MRNPGHEVFRITWVTDREITGAVLVLPGGKPNSVAPSAPWQLANLRVALLAGSLRRRLGHDVEVHRVRYRLRGWNPGRLDALRDGSAALQRLLTRVDSSRVVIVGHSMGARVAAHLAATGSGGAVAALAPWWPSGDGELIPAGYRLLTMHGTADTWTDPEAARLQTVQAAARGVAADWVPVPGAGHFMLRSYGRWHRTVADFAAAHLGERSPT